jgi:hypothetical protein
VYVLHGFVSPGPALLFSALLLFLHEKLGLDPVRHRLGHVLHEDAQQSQRR